MHRFSLLFLPLLASFTPTPEARVEGGVATVGPSAWMNARAAQAAVLFDLRSTGRRVPGALSPARFSSQEKRAVFLLGEPAQCAHFASTHALTNYFILPPRSIEFEPLPGVPQLSPTQARQKVEHNWPLFDISETEEFASSRLPYSRRMGYIGFEASPLLPHRSQPFIVACRVGHRSQLVVRQLRALGYDAYNLNGGLWAWECAGLPLEKAV